MAVFDAAVDRSDDSLEVVVAGDIDGSSQSEFSRVLNDAMRSGAKTINLDMSMVDFLGSEGINTLIHIRMRCRTEDVTLRIVKASRSVRRILDLMDLTDFLG